MRIIVFITFLFFVGCSSKRKVKNTKDNDVIQFAPQYFPGPQAIVYKTKANYNNLVPVLLSDDKTEIVSYPHIEDVKGGTVFLLPTQLHNGYLLDNKGINKNVAFLKLSYQEYSELKTLPTLKELYGYITDKDPLTEMCDCGNRTVFMDVEKQLNNLIDTKKIRTVCKTAK